MRAGKDTLLNFINTTGSTWVPQKALMDAGFTEIECGDEIVATKSNEEQYFTLKAINDIENNIAINIMRIAYCSSSQKIDTSTIEALVHEFEQEKNGGHTLHEHQIDAVKMVCNNKLSVLTGGPGTGKTTVLSAIQYVLESLNDSIHVVYTAPTGKAARRISESTGANATTLHKRLGLGYGVKKAERFYEDIIIIDESSMLDMDLADKLFTAIENGRKVVLVGDIDQLPSVGYGAILRDVIDSNAVAVTMLTKTFRQDNSSTLFKNIVNIRNGISSFVEGTDFHSECIENNTPDDTINKKIVEAYLNAVNEYGIDNVCILLPYRRKGICSNCINNVVQQHVNAETCGYRYTNKADEITFIFKKNDFVMQLENRDECANGDVGKVTDVDSHGVTVQYVDTTVHYSPSELNQIVLAYAMSIHKSQGSEYACVIMAVLNQHKAMLQRNLVYTGVTRAKKKCVVFYQKDALDTAIATKADANRFTMLVNKLKTLRIQYRTVYGI